MIFQFPIWLVSFPLQQKVTAPDTDPFFPDTGTFMYFLEQINKWFFMYRGFYNFIALVEWFNIPLNE